MASRRSGVRVSLGPPRKRARREASPFSCLAVAARSAAKAGTELPRHWRSPPARPRAPRSEGTRPDHRSHPPSARRKPRRSLGGGGRPIRKRRTPRFRFPFAPPTPGDRFRVEALRLSAFALRILPLFLPPPAGRKAGGLLTVGRMRTGGESLFEHGSTRFRHSPNVLAFPRYPSTGRVDLRRATASRARSRHAFYPMARRQPPAGFFSSGVREPQLPGESMRRAGCRIER